MTFKTIQFLTFQNTFSLGLSGGPVLQTLCVHCSGHGIPGRGSKISRKERSRKPCGMWPSLFVNKALLAPCLIHSLTYCQWLPWGPGQWWVTAIEIMQLAKAKICTIWPLQNGPSLEAQLVKNLPAMQETWVRSLGWEDVPEKERLPTPVFWPGEFHGLYSPQCRNEPHMTEQLSLFSLE